MTPNTLLTTTMLQRPFRAPRMFGPDGGAAGAGDGAGAGAGAGAGGGDGGAGGAPQIDLSHPAIKAALEQAVAEQTKDTRAKLDEFRNNNINLQNMLNSVGGPEKLAELQKLQQQLEHDEVLKLFASGKREEYDARLTGRMKESYTREMEALSKERDEWKGKAEEFDRTITQTKINGAIADAMREARVDPDYYDAVAQLVQGSIRVEDGQMVVFDKDGKVAFGPKGKPMTVQEAVDALREKKGKLFMQSSGGGATGGIGTRNSMGQFVLTREQAKDPQTYRRVREEAMKVGQMPTIID